MVLVSHTHKFIFVKNKKVAGTSVEGLYERYCVDPVDVTIPTHVAPTRVSAYGIVGARMMESSVDGIYNHMSLREVCAYLRSRGFDPDSYASFCVVRNPWDATVSGYYWYVKQEKRLVIPFERYVRAGNIVDNYPRYNDGHVTCSHVIRYERLIEDLNAFNAQIGLPAISEGDLPRFKTDTRASRRPYSEYYTDELREMVAHRCRDEIARFGYVF